MIVSGVDIGSKGTKAVIMDESSILGWSVIPTGHDSTVSAQKAIEMALSSASLSLDMIQYTVSTGYGRVNAAFADKSVTEISCHAAGNHWFYPDVRTILDVGGQDCKAIKCNATGKVTDFVMNDTCAAGTGRYLERVAASLELELDDMGPRSLNIIHEPLPVNSKCVVFAESNILKLKRQGKHTNDILAGATNAVVFRFENLLQRVGISPVLCISGGVAKTSVLSNAWKKRWTYQQKWPKNLRL